MLRVVEKFLWFPIKDNKKYYWLTKQKIVEKKVIYKITEWPLIPWGFGGPWTYRETHWEFVGIVDEKNAIEVVIENKDSPEPKY